MKMILVYKKCKINCLYFQYCDSNFELLTIFPCKCIDPFWYHFFAFFLIVTLFPFPTFAIVSKSDKNMGNNEEKEP